jgi:hypothetical protein
LRLSAVVSALVLLACAGLAAFAWTSRPARPPATAAATGMDVLRAYKCRTAETKRIIIRGVEDNHSLVGDEPNFVRGGRQFADTLSAFAGGSYEQVQSDRRMTDSFEAPPNTASGLFLVRLKAVANNDNDTFAVGDVTAQVTADPTVRRFSSLVVDVGKRPGWSRRGELHFAELSAIELIQPYTTPSLPDRTLLDFIRSGMNDGWIDVVVQDDTSVDFVGVALCLEPPRGQGLSLAPWRGAPPPMDGVVVLTCRHGGRDQHNCGLYVGDMPCATPLPVACIRPMAAPMPRPLTGHIASGVWSGGRLAFTEPTPGSRFATIGEVDRFCAARFGADWRAAELHDGTHNTAIAGFGDPGRVPDRVWVDILNQPYATCWARR